MDVTLSKTEISSFCGDILPLQLLGSEDLSQAQIRWSCSEEEILSIKIFFTVKFLQMKLMEF